MGPDRYLPKLVPGDVPAPRPAPADPSLRTYRFLSRAIAREYPRGALGVVLAFSSPDDDALTTNALLLQAYGLQAELDSAVLVIDARVVERGGGLTHRLGMGDRPGYAEVLEHGISDVATLVQPTAVAGVDVLPMGTAAGATTRMGNLQQNLAALLVWARENYGHVLLQVGPVAEDTRNLVTAAEADAVLLVASEHRTMMAALGESTEVLRDNGVRDIRALLVKAKP
jgi:hypothetical protein